MRCLGGATHEMDQHFKEYLELPTLGTMIPGTIIVESRTKSSSMNKGHLPCHSGQRFGFGSLLLTLWSLEKTDIRSASQSDSSAESLSLNALNLLIRSCDSKV